METVPQCNPQPLVNEGKEIVYENSRPPTWAYGPSASTLRGICSKGQRLYNCSWSTPRKGPTTSGRHGIKARAYHEMGVELDFRVMPGFNAPPTPKSSSQSIPPKQAPPGWSPGLTKTTLGPGANGRQRQWQPTDGGEKMKTYVTKKKTWRIIPVGARL